MLRPYVLAATHGQAVKIRLMETSPTGPAVPPANSFQTNRSSIAARRIPGEWIVLLLAAFLPSAVTYVYFCYFAKSATHNQLWAYAIAKTALFSLPIIWVGLVARESFPATRADRRTWLLSVSFATFVVASMWVFYAFASSRMADLEVLESGVQAKIRGLGVTTPLRYLALSAFYAIAHSFLEEYYWRWFFHHRLRAWLPLGSSLLISSLAFALHHVIVLGSLMGWQSELTYLLTVSVGIGGAVWAWLYERSGSLLPSWLSHALVDAGIFALGFWLASSVVLGTT